MKRHQISQIIYHLFYIKRKHFLQGHRNSNNSSFYLFQGFSFICKMTNANILSPNNNRQSFFLVIFLQQRVNLLFRPRKKPSNNKFLNWKIILLNMCFLHYFSLSNNKFIFHLIRFPLYILFNSNEQNFPNFRHIVRI